MRRRACPRLSAALLCTTWSQAMDRDSIFSSEESHSEEITELRAQVHPEASASMNDHDCLRFLRARPGSIESAAAMVNACHAWRHTLMEPLPPSGLRFSPNTIMASPHLLPAHPHIHLLPVAHHGWDKNGRPVYWEKTGTIQNNFDEVFRHFTTDELVQYHVLSQECFRLRFQYATAKVKSPITDSIVVFDMTNVNMTLNLQSISYIKRILAVDQMYYPETLHKLFIINCPWYFTALYGLFKPFIDQKTKDKFVLLRGDFLSTLLDYMDISQIPEDFGGESADVVWNLQNPESSGCSVAQIAEYVNKTYSGQKADDLLTDEEIRALKSAQSVADDIIRGRKTMWNIAVESVLSSDDVAGSGRGQVEALSSNGDAVVTSDVSPHHQRHHAHVTLHPMRTRMVKAEDASKYHLYCLLVEYGDDASWVIRRRFSDFYKFNEKLKSLSKDFPSVVWPKLPPKSFFKKAKSVVAVRLVGLDFFLSAVLDRMIRIEHDSTDEISGQRRATGKEPCAIALRQNLRIAVLDYLEVSDHVSTVPSEPISRDILIRQLRSIDIGENTASVSLRNVATSNNVDGPVSFIGPVTIESTDGAVIGTGLQGARKLSSYHIIFLCIAIISGVVGYYLRLLYISD